MDVTAAILQFSSSFRGFLLNLGEYIIDLFADRIFACLNAFKTQSLDNVADIFDVVTHSDRDWETMKKIAI